MITNCFSSEDFKPKRLVFYGTLGINIQKSLDASKARQARAEKAKKKAPKKAVRRRPVRRGRVSPAVLRKRREATAKLAEQQLKNQAELKKLSGKIEKKKMKLNMAKNRKAVIGWAKSSATNKEVSKTFIDIIGAKDPKKAIPRLQYALIDKNKYHGDAGARRLTGQMDTYTRNAILVENDPKSVKLSEMDPKLNPRLVSKAIFNTARQKDGEQPLNEAYKQKKGKPNVELKKDEGPMKGATKQDDGSYAFKQGGRVTHFAMIDGTWKCASDWQKEKGDWRVVGNDLYKKYEWQDKLDPELAEMNRLQLQLKARMDKHEAIEKRLEDAGAMPQVDGSLVIQGKNRKKTYFRPTEEGKYECKNKRDDEWAEAGTQSEEEDAEDYNELSVSLMNITDEANVEEEKLAPKPIITYAGEKLEVDPNGADKESADAVKKKAKQLIAVCKKARIHGKVVKFKALNKLFDRVKDLETLDEASVKLAFAKMLQEDPELLAEIVAGKPEEKEEVEYDQDQVKNTTKRIQQLGMAKVLEEGDPIYIALLRKLGDKKNPSQREVKAALLSIKAKGYIWPANLKKVIDAMRRTKEEILRAYLPKTISDKAVSVLAKKLPHRFKHSDLTEALDNSLDQMTAKEAVIIGKKARGKRYITPIRRFIENPDDFQKDF